MGTEAAEEQGGAPLCPVTGGPPRLRRARVLLGLLAAPLLVGGLLVASFHARRALIGERDVCTVTRASLAQNPGGYGGGDHPHDPEVGDTYVGTSGCLAAETVCVRRIELLGTRLDC